ncbi:MAG: hypothetical protein ACRDPI_06115 [Nocardioidaceae bacterium]
MTDKDLRTGVNTPLLSLQTVHEVRRAPRPLPERAAPSGDLA